MKIRGRRECRSCGTRWSYYETASVACPACGELRSVGIDDERRLHTARPRTLDLDPVRDRIDDEPIRELADRAADHCRAFCRGHGFVDEGVLQPLGETYLGAAELRTVGAELSRRLEVDDDEEWYLMALLRVDEGRRPDADAVPASLWAARGLACADAVETYRSELRIYLDEHPDDAVDSTMERLGGHCRRVRALDGDVSPGEADTLVSAARALGEYIAGGEPNTLEAAEDHLDALE